MNSRETESQADSSTAAQELGATDCWKYLRTLAVGRVGVVSGGNAEIFPVNYVPDDGSVVFRTGPGTKLNAIMTGQAVALEADGMNTYGTLAWSVVVKGIPEEIQDVDALPAEIPSPWQGGET